MKITKSMVLGYLSGSYQVPLENIEVISEIPNVWKHACVYDGVVRLNASRDRYCEMNGLHVEVAHCRSCNKLFVYYNTNGGVDYGY